MKWWRAGSTGDQVLRQQVVDANEKVAKYLEIATGTPVIDINAFAR